MIVTAHPIVDAVIGRYRTQLDPELDAYRNHVLRCVNYQQELLAVEALPDTAALAWAVHDLGLWTANTIDYLEPSVALADELAGGFGVTDIAAVHKMIREHHRLRSAGDRLTETFRIADRIDVSRGLLRGPVSRATVQAVVAELPYAGFHQTLLRRGTPYALRHPARPLPMFRW
ncbi:MAG: hypothetical protein JWN03_6118 [Nocardia sp.]|uniref:hypothetical protein n=1 Tax=Nocardia sp. TaxID=1821 RepID=UPI0026383287|nr:hypothetical protein [Nocardia sp.]MCU1645843.1 hypothetical protein [Nocardia sp.]